MIHSASPQSRPAVIVSLDSEVLGRTDRNYVKIVITTSRDCGRPRGSIEMKYAQVLKYKK